MRWRTHGPPPYRNPISRRRGRAASTVLRRASARRVPRGIPLESRWPFARCTRRSVERESQRRPARSAASTRSSRNACSAVARRARCRARHPRWLLSHAESSASSSADRAATSRRRMGHDQSISQRIPCAGAHSAATRSFARLDSNEWFFGGGFRALPPWTPELRVFHKRLSSGGPGFRFYHLQSRSRQDLLAIEARRLWTLCGFNDWHNGLRRPAFR